MKDATLQAFLPTFEAGISRFINGDPTLWKRNASHREDVTIMGAWGACEKGWSEASPRYDWAAARMRESGAKVQVEYLALRVTQLFRREAGEWKMIHRHADPLIGKTAPATVLSD
jgi:hypothetical protein